MNGKSSKNVTVIYVTSASALPAHSPIQGCNKSSVTTPDPKMHWYGDVHSGSLNVPRTPRGPRVVSKRHDGSAYSSLKILHAAQRANPSQSAHNEISRRKALKKHEGRQLSVSPPPEAIKVCLDSGHFALGCTELRHSMPPGDLH
jgi:hypothetical protein